MSDQVLKWGRMTKPLEPFYGRLAVLGPGGPNKARVKCCCEGEPVFEVLIGNLRRGNTNSCGCLWRERVSNAKATHGMSRTRIYHQWQEMHKRCNNAVRDRFKDWGGRGISVCEQWTGRGGFERFWSDMGDPPTEFHTLDRRDNDLGYSKENCRWATVKEQARNKRNNRVIEIDGESKCLAEWCELYDVGYSITLRRLIRGWDAKRALTTPALNNGVNGGAPR